MAIGVCNGRRFSFELKDGLEYAVWVHVSRKYRDDTKPHETGRIPMWVDTDDEEVIDTLLREMSVGNAEAYRYGFEDIQTVMIRDVVAPLMQRKRKRGILDRIFGWQE